MCPAIDDPASCEIRAVIRFFHVKNMSVAEIHRELCAVYGQNVTSEDNGVECLKMSWRISL
jgi:hypothetical protein